MPPKNYGTRQILATRTSRLPDPYSNKLLTSLPLFGSLRKTWAPKQAKIIWLLHVTDPRTGSLKYGAESLYIVPAILQGRCLGGTWNCCRSLRGTPCKTLQGTRFETSLNSSFQVLFHYPYPIITPILTRNIFPIIVVSMVFSIILPRA